LPRVGRSRNRSIRASSWAAWSRCKAGAAEPSSGRRRRRRPPRGGARRAGAAGSAQPPREDPQPPAPPGSGGKRRKRTATAKGDAERSLRDLVGAGPSQVGVGGAMRARDVNRPTEQDLAEAERELVIVRRHWKPPPPGPDGRGQDGRHE
jgi:hypothetical protein